MPDPPQSEQVSRGGLVAFAAIALVCVLAGGGYVGWAALSSDRPDGDGELAGAGVEVVPEPTADRGPTVVYQNVARDSDYAHVVVASDAGSRRVTPLICERVHITERAGLCLETANGLTGQKFKARILDARLRPGREITLAGILSRARVSSDGRYGATTSFIAGHSYADGGTFSTATTLIDMRTGERIANLEDFTVTHEGSTVDAIDVNFWGVTFAPDDSDHFYATMRTKGRTWLIEGSVQDRRAHTLRENVECPSLSPDGTRIAFKKRVDRAGVTWRLTVLDLRTMEETPLAETRNVDDQAEWLDDDIVLYGLDGDIWAVQADGSGEPDRRIADGLSPAAVRVAPAGDAPGATRR